MRRLVKEKENSEFKPVKLRLKIDLVPYPARAEGLINRIKGEVEQSKERNVLIFDKNRCRGTYSLTVKCNLLIHQV